MSKQCSLVSVLATILSHLELGKGALAWAITCVSLELHAVLPYCSSSTGPGSCGSLGVCCRHFSVCDRFLWSNSLSLHCSDDWDTLAPFCIKCSLSLLPSLGPILGPCLQHSLCPATLASLECLDQPRRVSPCQWLCTCHLPCWRPCTGSWHDGFSCHPDWAQSSLCRADVLDTHSAAAGCSSSQPS